MDLHRPLDLNKINEDFFSGKMQDDIDTAKEKDLTADEVESVNDVFSSIELNESFNPDFSLGKIKDLLSDLDVRESGIFHDVPEEKTSQEDTDSSFPEIEPDLSELKIHQEAPDKKEQKKLEKEKLKLEKENAEKEIDEEKKKLKELKSLEYSVQKPFRKRRVCVILLIFLLLFDMIVSAFSFLVSKTDSNYLAPLKLFGYNVNFVDGENIQSGKYINNIIFFKDAPVQGNQTILFSSDSSAATIGEIIAIGDNIYAINLETSVTKIESNRILGVINFAIPDASGIITIIRYNIDYLLIACISFAVIVLITFSMRIANLNKKIKMLKESYELV